MRKLILITGLSIIFHASYSQSDYVVTVKGDTLRGEVKMLSYDIIDRVQLSQDKKKKSYTALEVKTVFLKNETYHTVRYENRYKLMKLLKSGYLSLYGFRMEKQFSYDGRYLLKRDGEAMEVPNLTFRKAMQDFLKDCSQVSDQIKKGDLGRKNLDSVIVLYNGCIDQNTKQVAQINTMTNPTGTSLPSVEILRGKIENSAISSKQDVLDLIKDIDSKVKASQPVPNYLIEGLKGYLINTEFKDDLERVIEAVKSKQ